MTWTHKGRVVGCDSRTPAGYGIWVGLRETQTMWISEYKLRYRKSDGYPVGGAKFPLYRLDVKSIEEENSK